MSDFPTNSTAWYRSIPLSERIEILGVESGIASDRGEKLLEKWKSQPIFSNSDLFAQRLKSDNLTEEDFKYLLSLSEETIASNAPPPQWIETFADADANYQRPSPDPESLKDRGTFGFLYLIAPLIDRGEAQLAAAISTIAGTGKQLPFLAEDTIVQLLQNLYSQLLAQLHRTLILELNVARLRELLIGETPEERFVSFLAKLADREFARSILEEYPIIARQATIAVDLWVQFSSEFIQNLIDDYADICQTFGEVGDLEFIGESAGDRHRQGRYVIITGFSSGLKLVYKPRFLAIDTHFQKLLTWLNDRGTNPPFRTIKVLAKGDRGWVEFIEPKTCNSTDELERFYQRQGGYLALLNVLAAVDFHHENLIASGEDPILVDLEALFHNRSGEGVDGGNNIDDIYSVLQIGMLPQRVWAAGESSGVDLSGLGGMPGQILPEKVPMPEKQGTDQMRIVPQEMEMSTSQNRPTLVDLDIDVAAYTGAILQGFDRVYDLLLQHREEMLAPGGIVEEFATDEVRVIMRATKNYAQLLDDSFHPNVLRDSLDRERLFDRLWLDVYLRPELGRVITYERSALWENDIPLFVTRPDSRNVWSSRGEEITNFFPQTAMELVRGRFRRLSHRQKQQQAWLIGGSMATLVMGKDRLDGSIIDLPTLPRLNTDCDRPLSERLLAQATAIGDRLASLAIDDGETISWLGLQVNDREEWSIVPMGIDLYDGLMGITLFFAHLGKVTGEKKYTDVAQRGRQTIETVLARENLSIPAIGGFGGWGAVIYTLTQLGTIGNEPALIDRAVSLVDKIPPLIENDRQFDLLYGAAGAIITILELHALRPSDRLLEVARSCGNHLVATALPMRRGVGWTLGDEPIPLSGFSHGVAGISWALIELYRATGDRAFYDTALAGIEYERSLFNPELANWLDLRSISRSEDSEPHDCGMSWCHGAPGIGMGRIATLGTLHDWDAHQEINTALSTTLAGGFGFNHSLCHGDLGNLELILQAEAAGIERVDRTLIDRLSLGLLARMEEQGWICGVPLGVETPGLMTGLAGIGYGLLRLARPDLVPAVLLLRCEQGMETPTIDRQM
jgi:type 2 lantibiotic biosynthesis protein LanM